MNFFNFKNFDIFLLLLIILQIKSLSYADSLEVVAQFNIIQFKDENNKTINCSNCMLAGVS